MWRRFASNASANVVAGASSMVLQLGLTAIASRMFDREKFSVWSLAVSLAALTPLFGASLSTIVTRQLIGAAMTPTGVTSHLVMNVARRLALWLGAGAIVTIVLISLGLQRVSTPLAHTAMWQFATVVSMLTVSQLWQVGMQPSLGWHYAREENWTVAAGVFTARASALVSMWLAFRTIGDGNLMLAGAYVMGGTWLGLSLAYWTFLGPPIGRAEVRTQLFEQHLGETAGLLKGFAIWSIGSAAIQYGLPAYFSLISPSRYNAFYLAYTLNLIVVGVVGAAGAALMSPITRMRVSAHLARLVIWMSYAPLASGATLIVVLLCLWIKLDWILAVWAPNMASPGEVRSFLHLLGFQTLARSMAVIFAIVLSATGKPTQLVGPTLIEIALTLLVVVPLGWHFGERVLLVGLAVVGEVAALATAAVTVRVSGMAQRDQKAVLLRFGLTQLGVLCAWQGLAI